MTIDWWASGSGWQAGIDESWAIDNVDVTLKGTSVPEPATLLLLGSGLAGIAGWRKVLRRKQA